jgi:hypothetical protein
MPITIKRIAMSTTSNQATTVPLPNLGTRFINYLKRITAKLRK